MFKCCIMGRRETSSSMCPAPFTVLTLKQTKMNMDVFVSTFGLASVYFKCPGLEEQLDQISRRFTLGRGLFPDGFRRGPLCAADKLKVVYYF